MARRRKRNKRNKRKNRRRFFRKLGRGAAKVGLFVGKKVVRNIPVIGNVAGIALDVAEEAEKKRLRRKLSQQRNQPSSISTPSIFPRTRSGGPPRPPGLNIRDVVKRRLATGMIKDIVSQVPKFKVPRSVNKIAPTVNRPSGFTKKFTPSMKKRIQRTSGIKRSGGLQDIFSGEVTFGKNQLKAFIPIIIAVGIGVLIAFRKFIFGTGKR